MRFSATLLLLAGLLCAPVQAHEAHRKMTARDIVAKAIEQAGGEAWRGARTMHMKGIATLYRGGTYDKVTEATRYEMWRVYAAANNNAHQANGKFRLDSEKDGHILFQSAFDGQQAYDANGPIANADDGRRDESGAYGFGIIRFALNEGFKLERLADDQVEGNPAQFVKITDPTGGVTIFGVDMRDYSIRTVEYDTSRGWHQRIYSDFETKANPGFRQATRVRFYYNGVKTVDAKWQTWTVNEPISDTVFELKKTAK